MAAPLIDVVLPKVTAAKTALDAQLDTLDFTKIDEIMRYNAQQTVVSGGVGFVSKGLGALDQNINKATQ